MEMEKQQRRYKYTISTARREQAVSLYPLRESHHYMVGKKWDERKDKEDKTSKSVTSVVHLSVSLSASQFVPEKI